MVKSLINARIFVCRCFNGSSLLTAGFLGPRALSIRLTHSTARPARRPISARVRLCSSRPAMTFSRYPFAGWGLASYSTGRGSWSIRLGLASSAVVGPQVVMGAQAAGGRLPSGEDCARGIIENVCSPVNNLLTRISGSGEIQGGGNGLFGIRPGSRRGEQIVQHCRPALDTRIASLRDGGSGVLCHDASISMRAADAQAPEGLGRPQQLSCHSGRSGEDDMISWRFV